MDFFKVLSRGVYYRIRRVAKALKNWRKFGVIMFGSMFLATIALPGTLLAQDLLRVVVTPTSSTIQVGESQAFNAIVKLNGMPTTPDSLQWFVNSTLQPSASGQTAFTYTPSAAGTYQIRANAVKNGINGTSLATLVAEGPAEEDLVRTVITPTSSTIKVGENQTFNAIVKLNGTVRSADTLRWFVNTAERTDALNSTSLVVSLTVQGTYNIRAQATINGVVGTDYATLYVNPAMTNQPPVASLIATPNSGNAPLYSILNASGSYDPDGTIVKYEWDRDGNGSYEYIGSSVISYTYSTVGTYTARVRATDNYGNPATASATITVGQTPPVNQPPIANLVAYPASGNAPLNVTLNASGSYDPDSTGYIVSYNWDIDGSSGFELTTVEPITTRIYSAAGTYFARVRVIDNLGALSTIVTQTITVTNVPAPGQLTVTASVDNPVISTYGSTVFRAQAYRDGSPVAATYQWVVMSGFGSFTNSYAQNATFNAYGTTGTTSVRIYASAGGNTAVADSAVAIQGTVPPPADYIEVIISPWTQNVYPGNTVTYTARVYNRYGTNVTGSSSVLWSLPNSNAGYIQSQNNYGSYAQVVVRTGSLIGTFPVRAQAWQGTLYDADEVSMTVQYQYIPPVPPTPNYWLTASIHGVIENGSTPSSGDTIVYTLHIANYRPNTVHNILAKVPVPTHATFLSAYSNVDDPYITGGVVYWNVGDLYNGQVKTMYLKVEIKEGLSKSGVTIQAKSYISANEISGFTIYSNKLYVGGTGGKDIDYDYLVDTGIEIELLAMIALASLALSFMAYAFLNRREIMAKLQR
ncbi:MAG: PKD domain-containing protein [Candidatus Edwardsbacteria bacterium]|nr:PKD domain-containing protein [Candidatus Edwardsbacteria bacterium]